MSQGPREPEPPGTGAAPNGEAGKTLAPSSSDPRPAARSGSALFGRTIEVAGFTAALERLLTGEGGSLVLSGEPGIGKTRLLESLRARAVQCNVRTSQTTCQDRDRGSSFVPWTELLRQLVERLAPADVVTAVGEDYWSAIRLLPELEERVWLYSPDRPDRSTWDPGGFLDALARIFLRIADRSPLLVVLDDLGWADASSLELFVALGRAAHGHPLLLAGAYREAHREQNPQLDRLVLILAQDRRVRSIEIGPLGDTDVRRLVGGWIGVADVGDELGSFVTTRSAGNPFFAEELVQLLIESGEVSAAGAVVRPEVGLRGGVPGTVRAMIEQRLGRLPPDEVEVMRAASVLGLQFPYRLLVEASGLAEDRVLRAMEKGTRARLLRESIDRDRRAVYSFAHPLIQEALATQLIEPRARRIHESAARALIRDQDSQDIADARIAYHLLRTDQPTRALDYAVRAGDHAAELFAPAESAAQYRTVLQLLEESPPTELRARIEEALADQEFLLGDRRGARRLWKVSAARRLALGARASAAIALLKAAREDKVAESTESLRSAREMLGPDPEPSALFAWHMARGDAHDPVEGSQERVPIFREALALAESMGDPAAIASACRSLAANLPVGQVPEALALLDRTDQLARVHRLPVEAFWAEFLRAAFGPQYYGRFSDWSRHGETLLRSGKSAGLLHDAQFALLSAGAWFHLLGGRIAEGIALAERWAERMRLFAVTDDRFVGIYQAYPLLLAGEDSRAESLLHGVVQQGQDYGKWIFESGGEVWLAHLDTRHGDHARALRRLERARDVAATAGPSIIQARHGPYNVERLARAQIVAGDLEGARESTRLLERWASPGDSQLFEGYCRSARGQLRAAERQWAGARAELEACVSIWTGLDLRYELARAHEDLGLLHQHLGQADAARRSFSEAITIFQKMGAPPEAARVESHPT